MSRSPKALGNLGSLQQVLFHPILLLNVRKGILHGAIGPAQVPAQTPPHGAHRQQDSSQGEHKNEKQDPHQHR